MPTPTYSTDQNVTEKIAHVSLPEKIVVGNYREQAYNYINMRIKGLYIVPVSGSLQDMTYLKHVESEYSAGKILLSVGVVNDSSNISEYGKMLVGAAEKAIDLIAGSVDGKMSPSLVLSGAILDTDKTDNSADFPIVGISSPDTVGIFDRPISGIENDALLGKTDSEEYSALNDNLTT